MEADELQVQKMSAEMKYKRGMDNLLGNNLAKDIPSAIMWLEASARQGNGKADLALGKLYYEGNQVTPDYNKSILYLRRSANSGFLEADYLLGLSYYYGKGTPVNYEKAFSRFQKALSSKKAEVYFALGQCFEAGNGCTQNIETAVNYYTTSANAGSIEAKIKLADLYIEGTKVTRDYKKAFTMLRESIHANNDYVFLMLGRLYFKGYGVEKDTTLGIQFYESAIKLGNAEAAFRLGLRYLEGDGIQTNEQRAMELMILSAKADYEKAYFYAATFYYKGKYIDQDLATAIHYFELALKAGVAEAGKYLERARAELTLQKEEQRRLEMAAANAAAENQRQSEADDELIDRDSFHLGNLLNLLEQDESTPKVKTRRSSQASDPARPLKPDGQADVTATVPSSQTALTQATLAQTTLAQTASPQAASPQVASPQAASPQAVTAQQSQTVADSLTQTVVPSLAVQVAAAKNEFEALKQFAESGNAEAEFLLGCFYMDGHFIEDMPIAPADLDQAIIWLTKASTQNHPFSKEKLELCIKKKNNSKKLELAMQKQKLKQEAEEQQRQNEHKERIAALAAKNEFEALVQFAKTGNGEALFILGNTYLQGIISGKTEVVPIDIDKAIDCFTKALTAGNQEAFVMLAQCQDIKNTQEMKKQEKIKAKAMQNEFDALVQFAETGNCDALYYLGMSYFTGLHTETEVVVAANVETAFEFFQKAHDGGNADAQAKIDECITLLAEQKKAQEEKFAALAAKNEFDSLVQFAESGNDEAQYILATQYLDGVKSGDTVVIAPNKERCLYWLMESADKGNPNAFQLLETLEF